MGYIPSPPPLPYPMARNSVPPPKHGQIRMDIRIDEEGFPIVKIENPNEDGYLKVKLPKDAKDEDVKNVVAQHYSGYSVLSFSNDDYYGKIRVDDIKHKNQIELQKMRVRKASNGLAQIEGSIENSKAFLVPCFPPNILVNESTGEVTYDYVSEEQKRQWPQLKKDAGIDLPKKKQEPKPEYGEALNITKKKSFWERFTDRIIKNIVWGE